MLICSLGFPGSSGFPGSLKDSAVFLPGEAAVLRSVVSARQPAEPVLLAVLRPVLPTCNNRNIYNKGIMYNKGNVYEYQKTVH